MKYNSYTINSIDGVFTDPNTYIFFLVIYNQSENICHPHIFANIPVKKNFPCKIKEKEKYRKIFSSFSYFCKISVCFRICIGSGYQWRRNIYFHIKLLLKQFDIRKFVTVQFRIFQGKDLKKNKFLGKIFYFILRE